MTGPSCTLRNIIKTLETQVSSKGHFVSNLKKYLGVNLWNQEDVAKRDYCRVFFGEDEVKFNDVVAMYLTARFKDLEEEEAYRFSLLEPLTMDILPGFFDEEPEDFFTFATVNMPDIIPQDMLMPDHE